MITFNDLTEQMMQYKESLGYCRSTYKSTLRSIEIYVEENVNFDGKLKVDDILGWCERHQNEGNNAYRRRIWCTKDFIQYLYAMELCDRELPLIYTPVVREKPQPYMFTDKELLALFNECDRVKQNKANPLYQDIIAVIFRLIFYCGLRPNEGRELLRKDINLEQGTLLIRKNKTHRERLLPMADSVWDMCRQYACKRDLVYPDSEFFFPSARGVAYKTVWLDVQFKNLWLAAFPDKSACRVRVYDLRHRYATTVLANALDSGEDINAILPYLSAYMGHSKLSDTAYYIHLLPERLRRSPNFDFEQFSNVFPEVSDYEDD